MTRQTGRGRPLGAQNKAGRLRVTKLLRLSQEDLERVEQLPGKSFSDRVRQLIRRATQHLLI
jgi:hypothetical protein